MEQMNITNLKFCPKCEKIFQLYKGENYATPSYNDLNITTQQYLYSCSFCCSMLYIDKYSNMLSQIKTDISKYDYTTLKLITNFSPLFDLFHWYIIFTFNNISIYKETIPNLNTSLLRKCFKVLFTPQIEKSLNSKLLQLGQSDVEIVIIFDFDDQIYSLINSIIESCLTDKNTINKYTLTPQSDKSTTKKIINEILNVILAKEFENKINFDIVSSKLKVNYKIIRKPFYLSGFYIKLSRDIGQTKWERNGIRLCSSSVDEEIRNRISEHFITSTDDLIFSGGGREDRDVRMLISGREFIYEINNAKRKYNIDYAKITSDFNSRSPLVKIHSLSICDKNHFTHLKKSEDEKQKKYIAVIWISKSLNDTDIQKINKITNLTITQKTPIRVIHKRVLKTRERKIINMKVIQKLNDHFIILELVSSAGTYIKEFIHSDLGRTEPNMRTLLNAECDILQLDVINIVC